jgi:hypothetical protein
MRWILLVVALCALAPDRNYTVTMDDEILGAAEFHQRVDEEGNLRRKTVIYLRTSGPEGLLSREVVFMPDGRPKTIVSVERAYETNRTTEVTFTEKAATVVVSEGGGTQTKTYPVPRNWRPVDPSAWWWVRDTPQPGTSVRARLFDEEERKWVEEEIVYVGEVELDSGGGKMRTHQVEKKSSGTKWWLDSKGILVKLVAEQSGTQLVIERKNGAYE